MAYKNITGNFNFQHSLAMDLCEDPWTASFSYVAATKDFFANV